MGHENFKEMRKAMIVSQLRTSDVNDPRLIAAIDNIAREDFVPAASRRVAYSDRGVSIGKGRALNAPLATGRLLNAAHLSSDDKVLLIGAATGYTAAVLAQLAGSIVALEQSDALAVTAKNNLDGIDNVRIETGAHADGFAEGSPYSVIIIDGVVEQVPATLVNQLSAEGRLVAAIMDKSVPRLAIGHRVGGSISYQYFADCGGTVLPGFERVKSFSF